MKKLVASCIAIFMSVTVFSQINHFSNPDSKWFVRSTYMNASPYQPSFIGVYTTIYGFKGDTLINGKKWLTMYSSTDSTFTKDLRLAGYVYSKNEIVEFTDITGKLDTIYDFSIEKNDSIYFTFKNNERPNQHLQPSSVDSVKIGTVDYKRISFKEPTGPSVFDLLSEKWIWGIGSVHGPLHPLYLSTYSSEDGEANETGLVCTHLSDTLMYTDGHLCFDVQKNDWKSWYQVGTTWYINDSYNFPNNIEQGYEKFTVIKDTVVGGLIAQYITGYSETDLHKERKPFIVREENNRAYYWTNNQFKLMFDFNLSAGDTLHKTVGEPDCDSGFVVVDSISLLSVGPETLRIQHLVEYTYQNGVLLSQPTGGYTVTEKIGIIYNWTFGSNFTYNPSSFCGSADNFWHDGSLRCYQEPNGLYYNAKPQLSSCDLITSLQEIPLSNPLIHPNPARNTLFLGGDYYYHISDINGAVLISGQGRKVNVSSLSAGLYVAKLTNVNGQLFSQKFILE